VWFKVALCACVLVGGARNAFADTSVDFVRISCIEQAGFIAIEHRPIDSNIVVEGYAPESEPGGFMRHWTAAGYLQPDGLERECAIGNSKYRVTSMTEPMRVGPCSEATEAHLSLSRNDRLILDNVVFGFSCHGSPSIRSFSIGERKEDGHYISVDICFSKDGSPYDYVCWAIDERRFPLNQDGLTRLVAGR
jgi:hypothetical protein